MKFSHKSKRKRYTMLNIVRDLQQGKCPIKSGLTLHDFELTKTCDGPPRRHRRQDVV